ncbi:N-acetylmuramoyl-L-alanine amidase family protein [Caloranaerobacter azorensis]|uniref:N-acetylmuramoyl-L-alanine amidase family protein n=1 Tax=Caloranaerobacter azorensis TaxID=116090 RepID=UPI00068E91EC|nr:N-acetylmuramoyl-L-alanine amidase [Caloranaerobacter azorensis]
MKTLIIDAGHGGSDTGASAFGYLEKDLNLVIAKRVRELLREFEPDMTRTTDITLKARARANKIKDKYKYCLSIHLNAYNSSVSGIETIHSIYSEKGKQLAEIIAKNLNEKLGLPIRRVFSRKGKRGDYYYMHRLTGSTTTVIVEGLFLDKDIEYLNVERIAQGIASGFKEFMSCKEF